MKFVSDVMAGLCFSSGITVFATNKIDKLDITEILLTRCVKLP